jgi:hypothetical protein
MPKWIAVQVDDEIHRIYENEARRRAEKSGGRPSIAGIVRDVLDQSAKKIERRKG